MRSRGLTVLPDGTVRLGLADTGGRDALASAPPGGSLGAPTPVPGHAGDDDAVIPTADGGALLMQGDDRVNGYRLSTLGADGRPISVVARPGREEVGFPELSDAPDGSAIALWLDGEEQHTRVRYAIRAPGGPFGPARTLPGRFGAIDGVNADAAAGPGRSGLITAEDERGPTSAVLIRGGRPTQTLRVSHRTSVTDAIGPDGTAALVTESHAASTLRLAAPTATSFAAAAPLAEAADERLAGPGAFALAADGSPLVALGRAEDSSTIDLRSGPGATSSRPVPLADAELATELVPGPDGSVALLHLTDPDAETTPLAVALVGADGTLTTATVPPMPQTSGIDATAAAIGPTGELVIAVSSFGRTGYRTQLLRLAS